MHFFGHIEIHSYSACSGQSKQLDNIISKSTVSLPKNSILEQLRKRVRNTKSDFGGIDFSLITLNYYTEDI